MSTRRQIRKIAVILSHLPGFVASVVAWSIAMPYRVLSQDHSAAQPSSLEQQMQRAFRDLDPYIERVSAAPVASGQSTI
ncbi:hypothetical protein [Candidatus Poriferisodalis sp.]|uniref:hypothetical protein n=1 Tax=Candidatus Poriferisodalis sp. TaxID=3101277 RepID=UPI003B0297C9